MHRFKVAMLLHLSSMERKKINDIEKDTIVSLSYQVNEAFCCTKGLYEIEKPREVSMSYFFVRRITLMLSRISSELLISSSKRYNYKTFSESPTASLLHCIGNTLSYSSEKWRDSLTMAALSFAFVQYLFTYISLVTAQLSARKKGYRYLSEFSISYKLLVQ